MPRHKGHGRSRRSGGFAQASRKPLLRWPGRFAAVSLLVLSCRPDNWESWLTQTGVEFDYVHGQLFDQMEACCAAAVSGAGVALLPKFLFQREIDNGALKVVFEDSVDSRLNYRVVWPIEKEDNPLRSLFVDWLTAQPGTDDAPAA
jgi:LysR family glycine cleavage system transcriptional activator